MKKWLPVFPAALLGMLIFSTSCQKEISEEHGKDSVFFATGSLKDSNNLCLKDSVHGTFYNGVTPGDDTAYIEVQVNVASTGSYTISTDQQNGFLFSASGFFTSTGINTVLLKPVGTPILQKLTDFIISFDTSVCFVTVDVKDSTGTGLGGGTDTTGGGGGGTDSLAMDTWKFTASATNDYYGDAMGLFSTILLNTLQVSGFTASSDASFQIAVNFPTPVITPGTYTTGFTNIFSFVSITNGIIYHADASTGTDVVTIEITGYDDVTKVVTGSFSGTAQDASGNSVPITKGAFKTVVN